MYSKRMFHEVIFLRYRVPRIVTSDGGSHLIDQAFQKALTEVGVDHWIATPYHPQTSGQAETLNKQIKNILLKTMNQMGRSWRSKLSETLCAYRMAYKTPISMSPHQLVYGKTCHLPIELEHKALWAIKKWNMDLKAARTKRKIQIAELEEWRKKAYRSAKLYKERTKRWHDNESRSSNLSQEIRYFSLTLPFIFWLW
jgi:transposase InsO family protein